ncbi:VCBS repeat-containing protein [Arthrobacter sp. 31Y]|uniref:VCBS repeat-containing protein n=1 Tax=Arthrobacter sp. 31Y TaxID=1115632 RepID=UPI00214AE7F8|nr:VCBS repeat-containing protein [Arthrobacter sp. 31Y]
MRSSTAAGVPEKSRQLRLLSKLTAALVAALLMMVGLPATPASAVTPAAKDPDLTSVELVSGAELTPGQTARVRFALSQPAQSVVFNYYDESLSETRQLTWSGNPGAGAFTAEATAAVGGADYYDGLHRLSSIVVRYQKPGLDYPYYVQFLRDSSGEGVNVDGRGDPRLQSMDFVVKNPSRVLAVPQNSIAPSFAPKQDSDWNQSVQGTISPGSWSAGVNRIKVQWVADGVVGNYGNMETTKPFVGWASSRDFGKDLRLRITTTTPGFKAVSAESVPYLFVAASPFVISGKPWIGSTLKTNFDVASIKGIPVGSTPKVEVLWRTRSTSYAGAPLAPGASYLVKDSDGGGSISVVVVISLDGKIVGRFGSDWTVDVTNPAPSRQFESRGVNDYYMVRSADGRLWKWGPYFGAFPREIGSGWNVFDKIFSPGDFNEDGFPDVLARKPSGELWMYPTDGQSWWKPASVVGVGWQGMTELIAPGDFDSDGHDDVLAKDRDGRLLLYPGNGKGGWLAPRQVGAGWNMFNRVFSPGDFDGDSHADLLATNSSGQLFLYSSNGRGGWLGAKVIGSGWQSFKTIYSAGDRDGDGWHDVLGVDGAGYMYVYPFKSGNWKPRGLVGADWDVFTALF